MIPPVTDWASRIGLERALRRTLEDAGAPPVTEISFRKQSHNAVVFHGTCADAPVFIKQYQTDYGPRLVRNTVEETGVVKGLMADGPGGVVDVIWASEPAAVVIMSAAQGDLLTKTLAAGKAATVMPDVADWLRRYVGPRVFEDSFSTSYWLKQRQAMDVTSLSPSDQRLVSGVLELQRGRSAALGRVPVWKGRLPKDFAPHNLHWDEGAVWGFDIEGYTTAALSRVFVTFCVLAEKILPDSWTRRSGLQDVAISPFLEAFSAYADPPELLDYQATDLALARFVQRNGQPETAQRLRHVLTEMLELG